MECSLNHSSLSDSKYCPECGTNLSVELKSSSDITFQESKKSIFALFSKRVFAGTFVLTLLVFGISGFGNSSGSTYSSDESSVNESIVDVEWAPAGFTVLPSDSNVAFRWSKGSCSNYDCVHADFITKTGCPNSFYAAVNWLNTSESVVSYDNETLPSLMAMQRATLRFDDIEGNGSSAQISEVSCR